MADEWAEQWRLEVDEGAEAWVKSTAKVDVSDISEHDDIGDNVEGTTNGKGEIFHETGRVETGESSNNVVQVVEEELVALEFEKVKPKLATHSMHCSNCKSEITQVILRRKVYQPVQKDLVRCFSCSSLFTCSDNGCFKPFDIFHKRPVRLPSSDLPQSSNATGYVDSAVIIEDEPETIAVVARSRRTWLVYEGILAEILKSVIYGGLMEVIASLSIVVSAAASNVTTLSIISLALASLIGGVFIIGHNLWDLRDDCYKDSSSHERKKVATYKYKDLLGQVNYFPLHAFFAILSFLVFGMVPPIAYRYSYHETKDKDYTVVVVAIVSLLCVSLLAIVKAYINKCTVIEYFKTVIYYIIIAVSSSGVSYVVGNLVARLLDEPGWFATSSGGGMPCLPHVTSPYLETF